MLKHLVCQQQRQVDLYTDESQIREQLGLSQIGLSQDLHLELQSTQTGNNVNSNSAEGLNNGSSISDNLVTEVPNNIATTGSNGNSGEIQLPNSPEQQKIITISRSKPLRDDNIRHIYINPKNPTTNIGHLNPINIAKELESLVGPGGR